MKTSSERQRGRSMSSPPRPQSRPSPKSKSKPKTNKNRTRTRAKTQLTMTESPPSDTISLDSSNEDGPADPLSSPDLSSGPSLGSGPDVVDLTSPTSDPAAVVDLTNDTVLVLDEDQTQSYVVSSDEEEPMATGTTTTPSASASGRRETKSSGVQISCPVCMDSYFEIVDSGRLLVSTRCGHVFCSICLRDALNQSHTCPICRKKLSRGHYHPLHI